MNISTPSKLGGIHDSESVAGYVPEFLMGAGVFFLIAIFGTWIYYDTLSEVGMTAGIFVSFTIELIYISGLIYGGYWLKKSNIGVSRYPRIAKWTLAGGGFFVIVNLLIMAFFPPESMEIAVGWIRSVTNLGMAVGVLVGTTEARAIQREIKAEREATRAEEMEKTRDLLEHLNGLLRHEVLNSVTVIQGNIDLLLERDELNNQSRDHLEKVRSRCDEISGIVDDVRVLIKTSQGVETLDSVNLSEVLEREEEKLQNRLEDVEIESSIPDDIKVAGNELLPRVFSNILSNAVEHNEGSAHIEVELTINKKRKAAIVHISDNGPGISEDIQSSLFERSTENHGMGMYLVSKLVDQHDGSVELEETGPDGSTFVVELPLSEEVEIQSEEAFGQALTGCQ